MAIPTFPTFNTMAPPSGGAKPASAGKPNTSNQMGDDLANRVNPPVPGNQPTLKPAEQQNNWNPANWLSDLSSRSRPAGSGSQSVGGLAQENAGRILPNFNNGNPAGANNMPRQRQWWEQPEGNRYGRGLPTPSEATTGWYQDEAGTGYRYNDTSEQQSNQASYDRYLAELDPEAVRRDPAAAQRQAEEYMRQFPDEFNRLYGGGSGRQNNQRGRFDDFFVGNNRSGYNYGGGNPYAPGNSNYYGGQSPGANRYIPPMFDSRGNLTQQGPYNYNLPNAFGSYPGYGQGNPNSGQGGPGYGDMFIPPNIMPWFPGG